MKTLILITLSVFVSLTLFGCGKDADTKSTGAALAHGIAPATPITYTVKNYKVLMMKTTNRVAGISYSVNEQEYSVDLSNHLYADNGFTAATYNSNMGLQDIIQQDCVGIRFTFTNMDTEDYTYDVYINNVFQYRGMINNQPGTFVLELGSVL